MPLPIDFASAATHLNQSRVADRQATAWSGLLRSLLAALLSVAIAGCDRQSESPTPSRNPPASQNSGFTPQVGGARSEEPAAPGLPLYELKMDAKSLAALDRNPGSNETHPATFVAEGEVHTNVQVRFRGEWARSWPKKPLKIFFSRGKPFQGHHSMNLNSAWRDPAFVRETLAYHVYAVCDVPASQSRMVRLHLNGKFRGVYVEVEQVDKPLLSRFNLKGAGLFKAASDDNQADERDLGSEAAFAPHYENESEKTNGLRELQLFCRELARTTNTLDFFTRRVDLDKYINYLAATVLVQHWDCFNKNHFLVYDRTGSGKWFALPWDLDRTFGDHWTRSFDTANLSILLGTRQAPGVTGWNRLQDRFLGEPTLRARFLDRLAELLESEFTPEKLFPLLDRLESELEPYAAQDRRRWPGVREDLHSGIAGVKSYIERRRAFLQRELRQLR
jgi:spore coat protein H